MMRIPTGTLHAVLGRFTTGGAPLLIGASSFESARSLKVANALSAIHDDKLVARFVEIDPVDDGYPDYSDEVREKVLACSSNIRSVLPGSEVRRVELLASSDGLIDLSSSLTVGCDARTTILDISCFPKRLFCFLVASLLRNTEVKNLLATYTPVTHDGYTLGRLAEDPMSAGFLPGFAANPEATDLVVSLGFESLGCAQLIKEYLAAEGRLRVILPFPPHPTSLQRSWRSLREIARGQAHGIRSEDVEVVSATDAERVTNVLEGWVDDTSRDTEGLLLAPFGPKPHTLAMALFSIARGHSGLMYTQPKAYNPRYSAACSEPLAYVLKWDGLRVAT